MYKKRPLLEERRKLIRDPAGMEFRVSGWILPPLSNSWIIITIWLYIALNKTPNLDCYWVGAVPKFQGFREP